MIDGCLDWQENGLVRPDSVVRATESYFEDQDLMSQWLSEECDAEPGNIYKWEPTAKLFASWTEFANQAGEEPGSSKAFERRVDQAGVRTRHRGTRQDPRLQRGETVLLDPPRWGTTSHGCGRMRTGHLLSPCVRARMETNSRRDRMSATCWQENALHRQDGDI